MTALALETDPIATHVEVTDERLTVHLADGRALSVPLTWFPRLVHGSAEERANWRLLGDGDAIEWPDLDEHVGVDGLLVGRGSGESQASFQRWLALQDRSMTPVVSIVEYRGKRGSDTWHSCPDCSTYPITDFDISTTRPAGELCNECRSKEASGACR